MPKHTQVPTNFIYPDIKESHFRFGSAQLLGEELRPDGDWRPYLPPEEEQNVRGIESSACYIEGQQHAIATIEEETYGEIDNNYSSRFNALLSDGTEQGGDPLKGADSIRHDGLIKDSSMPFSDEINSFDDFHSFKGVNEDQVRAEGKEYLSKNKLGFDIVFEKNTPLTTKYLKLKQALRFSPCPVSVVAWFEQDGVYVKPEGMNDNHLVEAVYVDDQNRIHIRDTYYPFYKILAPNFSPDFAMRWAVEKKSSEAQQSFLDKISEILKAIGLALGLIQIEINELPKPVPPLTPESKPKEESLITKMALAIQDFEGYESGSKSFRNKNPGNLKGINGNFLVFKTYEEGFDALTDYITRACTGKHKAYKPEMTLFQFFSIYAPDGNQIITNYCNFVCKRIGKFPSTKLKELV